MTLNLHPGCRTRLVDAIRDAVPALEFEQNNSLYWMSVLAIVDLDDILPANRPTSGSSASSRIDRYRIS